MAAKKKPRLPGRHHRGGASPRTPFLDACLIVKNEEANLPGCLESLQGLRPLLASVNVYDTGSTDRTVEVAREAGCVVVEGYWDDDFARARNESLAMSRAQWALVIDADERVFADPTRLEAALRAVGRANVVDAELYHLDGDGDRAGHTRYIKAVRPDRIRFVHPVHEIVDALPGHDVRIVPLPPEDLHFTHLGYATPDIRRGKATRNLSLADAAVRDARARGDDVLLLHALRHRARSRFGPGSLDGSLSDLQEAWSLCAVGGAAWVTCGLDIVDRQRQQGALDAADETLAELVRGSGRSPRWRKAHAENLLLRGDLDAARREAGELLVVTAESTWDGEDESGLDRREVLDLRLRVALHAQERHVAVAVLALLVEQGEVDRLAALGDLWVGPPQGLAALLGAAARGTHGAAVIAALRTLPGVGRQAAEVLEVTRSAQNG